MEFRKAVNGDIDAIWEIIQYAIKRRKDDGSKQWQDGYPNRDSVVNDIANNYGYVIREGDLILAYGAVIFDVEPAYEAIEGAWLSKGPYVVIHRLAASPQATGMGIATHFFNYVAELAKSKQVNSIKVDTNYDNVAMLKILDKLGYSYCGEVYFRGSARKAFEKVI